jgi:hypothetical protein
MTRTHLQPQAIILRKQGLLYSEIALKLGLAKSTTYKWTHDILLTDEEVVKIAERLKAVQSAKIDNLAMINKQRHMQRDLITSKIAAGIVRHTRLSQSHKRLICAVMFWCEGGKDTTSGIQFINSDPLMVQKFLELLRSSFEIREEKLRALVHLHQYHHEEQQLKYWSQLTCIPLTQFHKSYIKPHTGKNTRSGYPGCISIRYLDSSLGKLLKMIYIEFSNT